MKGVGLTLITQVGNLGGLRIALLQHIVCAGVRVRATKRANIRPCSAASNHLGEHEVVIHDAGASIDDMQKVYMKRYGRASIHHSMSN